MLSEKYEKYIIYDQPLPEADKDISPQVLESWKRSKKFPASLAKTERNITYRPRFCRIFFPKTSFCLKQVIPI